jgi:hypothetical protein
VCLFFIRWSSQLLVLASLLGLILIWLEAKWELGLVEEAPEPVDIDTTN